jgi:hypothetical protein
MLPQHCVDKSVKIQVDTNSNKFDLYQQHMVGALFGTAMWSNSPTINDVTLPAEFMLKLLSSNARAMLLGEQQALTSGLLFSQLTVTCIL